MPAEHIDCCGRLTWEGISIWTWAGAGRDRPLHQAITLDLEDTSVLTSTLEDLVPDPVRLGPIGLTDGDLVPCPLAEGSSCHPRLRDGSDRSEEHTSELQSRGHLVCRLLLEKKKIVDKVSHNKK